MPNQIQSSKSKKIWNDLIGSHSKSQFLQSWEWGEFQESVGRKVWRLGIGDDAAQIIKHNLPLGKSYLYVPRAVMSHQELVIRELKKIAQQENSIFIKIEPVSQLSITCPDPSRVLPREATRGINYLSRAGSRDQLSKPVQPQTTLYLDLTKSEEQILSSMHQKTRYNIRLAEKHGVTVKESDNINEFLKLNRETVSRDKFKSHPDEYYRKMFQVLGNYQLSITCPESHRGINYQSSCCIKLFSAHYSGQVIASNLVAFFADTATYLHGASSNEHRNLMAPHLLQWGVIKYAKAQGYKWYDFWGVNPSQSLKAGKRLPAFQSVDYKKAWEGITRFKRGFVSDTTGQEVTYPGCFNLPISKFWYIIYRVMKLFKR